MGTTKQPMLVTEPSAVQQTRPVLVQAEDGSWLWDLAGESLLVPVVFRAGGRDAEILAEMRPFGPLAAYEWLRSMAEARSVSVPGQPGSYRSVPSDDGELVSRLFSRHNVGCTFRGEALTTEQVDKLDAVHGVKRVACQSAMDAHSAEPDQQELSIASLFDDPVVYQELRSATPDGALRRVRIAHRFRAPMESDRQVSRSAINSVETRKGKLVTLRWEALAALYDRMIERIDGGILCDRAACNAGNRAQWLPLVPTVAKTTAVIAALNDSESKNG